MSEAIAAPAAPAPAEAGKPAAPPAETPEDLIELALEEGKPAIKVPRSKLDPHLAKYRSETDKLRSEYDRNQKEFATRSAKLEAVLRAAKDDPDSALKELGLDPDAYAEKRLAAKVAKALREAEEQADPTKKVSREADEERDTLRAENEKLKKDQAEKSRTELMGRLKNAVEAVRGKLPEAYQAQATNAIVATFREALAAKKDISIEDAAKAVTTVMRDRAKSAYEKDEDLRKLLGLKPAEPAKAAEHPAAKPAATRAPDGKFKPADTSLGAGDVLQQIARGKF